MGFAVRSGVRLYWRLEGARERPTLLLLHPLGSDLNIWDRTLPLLTARLRVLRMDLRGTAPPISVRVTTRCRRWPKMRLR